MKIVVIGGSGLIGSRVVNHLRERGNEVIAASPSKGINAVTGEGLQQAMAGAEVVIDVSNPPSFEERTSLDFFEAAGRNLKAEESRSGVRHHIALSVVGSERLQEMGYFRAKLKQEELIQSSGIPFTIVRATQFFEFVGAIAQSGMTGNEIHLPPVLMQPIAVKDVATTLADIALSPPVNRMLEVAGPEVIRMDELVRLLLSARGESYKVLADPQARYFSTPVDDHSLMPGTGSLTALTRFSDWLKDAAAN